VCGWHVQTLDVEISQVDRLNELASEMTVSYEFVQSEVSAASDAVNSRLQRLCSERSPKSLHLHVTELRLRNIRRVSFVAEPSQYVRELRLLNGTVTAAEHDMASLLVQEYKFDLEHPQDDELKVRPPSCPPANNLAACTSLPRAVRVDDGPLEQSSSK